MRKFRRDRSVCAPQYRSAGTSIGPKLSVSVRAGWGRDDGVDRAMIMSVAECRLLNQARTGPASRLLILHEVAWISCATITSCGSDPAARLRRPRSVWPALPDFRLPQQE